MVYLAYHAQVREIAESLKVAPIRVVFIYVLYVPCHEYLAGLRGRCPQLHGVNLMCSACCPNAFQSRLWGRMSPLMRAFCVKGCSQDRQMLGHVGGGGHRSIKLEVSYLEGPLVHDLT